jgi:hypothetical protein
MDCRKRRVKCLPAGKPFHAAKRPLRSSAEMQRRPRRTKAEMQPVHDAIAKLSRQGLGPAAIADRLGEPRIVVTQIRARMGLSERRGTTKPGDPQRAKRLLRALKGYWEQSDLEWPEIARRCDTTQSTVWCWYEGKRQPTDASLDKIERFLGAYHVRRPKSRQAQR